MVSNNNPPTKKHLKKNQEQMTIVLTLGQIGLLVDFPSPPV